MYVLLLPLIDILIYLSHSPTDQLADLIYQFALGLLTIIPWAVLLAFDLVLYISRMSLYEMPVLGGRARGREGGGSRSGSVALRVSRGGVGGELRSGVGASEMEGDKTASPSASASASAAVSLVAGQVETSDRDTDGVWR